MLQLQEKSICPLPFDVALSVRFSSPALLSKKRREKFFGLSPAALFLSLPSLHVLPCLQVYPLNDAHVSKTRTLLVFGKKVLLVDDERKEK